MTLGGLLALPLTLMMLRRKFEGNLGGREITRTYAKAIVAALASGVDVLADQTTGESHCSARIFDQ